MVFTPSYVYIGNPTAGKKACSYSDGPQIDLAMYHTNQNDLNSVTLQEYWGHSTHMLMHNIVQYKR